MFWQLKSTWVSLGDEAQNQVIAIAEPACAT